MSVALISPKALSERSQGQNTTIIDVRTPAEFEEIHAVGTQLMPLDKLDPKAIQQMIGDKDLYVICKGGNRSKMACEKLMAAGITNVYSVDGGTTAWADAGLPVVRGRKTMSLERQVRITAGMLALTGVILGYFVHEGFLGLSAFIGAGLTFSGLTDTCGMGMVLAKMPWNQRSTSSTCRV